ncbi:MAG: VOC family protein [Tepidiformaceae bacterium]
MPKIMGVAHVELSVADLDVSSVWYSKLLGGMEVYRAPNEEEGTVACVVLEPNAKTLVAFTQHTNAEAGRFTPRRTGLDHVSFGVESEAEIEAWAAHLDALGIERSPVRNYGYANAITFQDPDGIALELFQSTLPAL